MIKHFGSMALAAAVTLYMGAGASLPPTGVQAASAPTSYPLVCKGGPNMTIDVNHGEYGATVAVLVTFRWAARAASQAPPGPGECAWLDRTGRLGEPVGFRAGFRDEIYVAFDGRGQISAGRLASAGADSAPGVRLIQDILAGRVFYLHAYAGGSWLVVTRFGP